MKSSLKKLFAVLCISAFASTASADSFKTMTLENFMEDYAKPAAKLARGGNEEPMMRILAVLPSMAAEADRKEWEGIINKAVSAGKASASCRACHSKFKKSYQKDHKDLEVVVSAELLAFLSAQ